MKGLDQALEAKITGNLEAGRLFLGGVAGRAFQGLDGLVDSPDTLAAAKVNATDGCGGDLGILHTNANGD